MTIPPISLDPKTYIQPHRLDIIEASMAVGLWDKEGIIDIVDEQLKRPQDGTGYTRQEGDSTLYQDP